MNIEPGRGKGHLAGATPVVIKDRYGIIYGWRNMEKAKGQKHQAFLAAPIDIAVFLAWLHHFYPGAALPDPSGSISLTELKEIDSWLELSVADARVLDHIQRDYEAGKITAKSGESIFPGSYDEGKPYLPGEGPGR